MFEDLAENRLSEKCYIFETIYDKCSKFDAKFSKSIFVFHGNLEFVFFKLLEK